jgi:hypothetical protein
MPTSCFGFAKQAIKYKVQCKQKPSHKNKLDPKDRYFLPNGIQVCKECAARHNKRKGSK